MSVECRGCGQPMLSDAADACGTNACTRIRKQERRAVLLRVAGELRVRAQYRLEKFSDWSGQSALCDAAEQYEREAAEVK